MNLLLVPAAYVLGSISWGLLVVRWVERRDLRQVGSGNTGATNVLRVAGKGPAGLVLCLDILKGTVPVALGRALDVETPILGATAVAAVVGHMVPLFHAFRGGKGVATAAGALGALRPWMILPAALVFLVVVVWTRYVSLASLLAVAVFALLALAVGDWVVAPAGVVAALVVVRHRGNIARLWSGEERRLGERRAAT
ncbi:MAG: glycerol-3-phosphate 1-O-acyltransferase PlsY [Thermoanaerobaculia bacterium]|nr:glycerol-3-phosphate 1-O-acyltransferase PlsY [Thermoanaerobaculia bacterium]